jgi:branched-chain amino acid aminotransferase
MPHIFLNGSILDANEASISASDGGFLYGVGLYEILRTDGGRIFALSDHMDRLLASATALAIACPFDKPALESAIRRVLQANELTDARIRLTLTAGSISGGESPQPTLLITASPQPEYPQEYYRNGVRVALADFRQNPFDPTTGHKTTSFLSRLTALNRAMKKGCFEAVWFTPAGVLAEACMSNVFLVKDSALLTPRIETPVMPGIARKHILQLAEQNQIACQQKDLTIKDLLSAQEVFLTSVSIKLLPVVGIEAHTVGEGKVGPVTKKMMEAFDRLLASEPAQGDRP